MKRIGFVILHYLAVDVTRRCVDFLLENSSSSDMFVVVVDNASPDGSGPLLSREYASNPLVSVLLLDSNSGFARGNNAGCRYAVDNFDPDFLVVMNNDVMIEDKSFIDRIAAVYDRTPFAVLGPDIYSSIEQWHQSPIRLSPMPLNEVKQLRMKMFLKYRFFAYHYLSWNAKLLLGLSKATSPKDSPYWTESRSGCVLHGACLIFSRDFLSVRKDAFNPSTFLYAEEDILALECSREGLPILYSPDLKVNHLEDASTKAAFKSDYARSRMKYKRLVESLDVLIALMDNE